MTDRDEARTPRGPGRHLSGAKLSRHERRALRSTAARRHRGRHVTTTRRSAAPRLMGVTAVAVGALLAGDTALWTPPTVPAPARSGSVLLGPAVHDPARSTQAQQARLSALAEHHAADRRAEALAVARAAVDAGEAAVQISEAVAGEEVGADLQRAYRALRDRTEAEALQTARPPEPAPGDRAARPDATEAEVPATEAIEDAEDLDEGARDVFALSHEVESAVTAPDAGEQREAGLADVVAALEAAEASTAVVDGAELSAAPAGGGALLQAVAAAGDEWPNGAIPPEALCPLSFAPGELLRCDAAEALEELNAAYRADTGSDLVLSDTYRSYGEQVQVKQSRGWLAAAPGTSNHGRGLAVDFAGFGSVGQFDAPGYRWMARHAADFGWHHPPAMGPGGSGPQEPWHWEFGTLREVPGHHH